MFSSALLNAGELTVSTAFSLIENQTATSPDAEKNTVVLNKLLNLSEDDFTSENEYLEFLKCGMVLVDEHFENHIPLMYYLGKELQRYHRYKDAYPFIYKTVLLVENDPISHGVNCDYFETVAHTYYFFGRNMSAEEYLHNGIDCDGTSKKSMINMYNTLGLIKSDLHEYEQGEKYFKAALKIAHDIEDRAWYGVISGNLGNIEVEKKDYESSKKHIVQDYEISVEHHQWGSAVLALGLLTRIHIETNDFEKAEKFMHLQDSLIKAHEPDNSLIYYYQTKSKYYSAVGKHELALENYKLFKDKADSMNKARDINTINNAEFQINFEKKQSENQLLKQTQKTDRLRILSLLILIPTIIIIAVVLIWQISKRRKREKEIMYLQKLRMEEDLQRSEQELNNLLNNLIVKNAKVQELNEQIDKIQSKSEKSDEMTSLTARLQSFTFLTDEDWVMFKRLFEKRFPGFFEYFEKGFPSVTNAEMRLAALIKLKLDRIEMSKALGISPDSVRKTNLRLRKKLNIEDKKELNTLIHSI